LSAKYAAAVMPYHKDSRALARAITAQLKQPPHEILFVDKDPYYGMGLYLDLNIERVSVYDKAPGDRHIIQEEPLAAEVAESSTGMDYLFLVPERAIVAFNEAAAKLGYQSVSRGCQDIPGHAKLYFLNLKKGS
jgi:hypothetical protein